MADISVDVTPLLKRLGPPAGGFKVRRKHAQAQRRLQAVAVAHKPKPTSASSSAPALKQLTLAIVPTYAKNVKRPEQGPDMTLTKSNSLKKSHKASSATVQATKSSSSTAIDPVETALSTSMRLWSHHRAVIDGKEAAAYYELFSKIIVEHAEKDGQEKVRRPFVKPGEQRWVAQRRLVCYFAQDVTKPYVYSGASPKVYGWMPQLQDLATKAQAVANRHRVDFSDRKTPVVFTRVLINFYRTGGDLCGQHRDADARTKYIASYSLYPDDAVKGNAPYQRDLFIYNTHGARVDTITQDQGDLVLMHPEMQQDHKHSVPERSKVKCGRINLTFREDE